MGNNYSQGDQKRTGGRKRTGKSLVNKSSASPGGKSSGRTKSLGPGKYSERTAGRPGRYSDKAEGGRPGRYPGQAEGRTSARDSSRTEKRSNARYSPNTEGGAPKRFTGQGGDKPFQRFKPRPKKTAPEKPNYSEEIRLNRFISNAGVCSRREADKYITSGVVSVNGKIVTELGTKVKPTDDIRFDGRKLNAEKKVYLLLNKPKDFVTTTDDPHADKTVMDLVKNACEERIYPVGRLDRNTTGVLLFTNDGDLSKKLMHPSHNMKKIYQVSLDKSLSKEHLLEIAEGVELEDGRVAADAISFINADDRSEIGIEIHSGRNHIVRRIFEHLGYRVKKLDRVYFAGLTKKNLPRGKFRFLTDKEVQFLKMQ